MAPTFLSAPMPRVLKLAPAHMDIHKGNIVCTESGQLALLDWEYAANTDIGLSLETYFQANQLNTTQRDFSYQSIAINTMLMAMLNAWLTNAGYGRHGSNI